MIPVYGIEPSPQNTDNQRYEPLTAPIKIPRRADMEVTLVPITTLDRLEEYRADESLWLSACGLFVGLIGGVGVNVATGGRFDAAAIIILVVFVLMATATGWCAWRAHRRADAMKRTLAHTHEGQ